ncbi:MAG: ABC transporter ATP-binding protein [Candidatus Wallbacteria bacterium]|nr:ABC transporter ATP-binding protein [Candidatus Wallbacteria bacterium]
MEQALVVEKLDKFYGKIHAVKGISFEVKKGEIFALIGPNGAGKSTTLRIISTILSPSAGRVEVAGFDLRGDPDRVRESISYLPEESGAYRSLTGMQYLWFMAGLFSGDQAVREQYISRAKAINGLGDRLNHKVRTYSKGMTRKLLISRALMTSPRLAVLDEPTSGLDILSALDVRKTIREFASSGSAVLLSSHNMLEIEYLSDRVGIIHQGTIFETGTPAELKKKYAAANLEEVFAEVAK